MPAGFLLGSITAHICPHWLHTYDRFLVTFTLPTRYYIRLHTHTPTEVPHTTPQHIPLVGFTVWFTHTPFGSHLWTCYPLGSAWFWFTTRLQFPAWVLVHRTSWTHLPALLFYPTALLPPPGSVPLVGHLYLVPHLFTCLHCLPGSATLRTAHIHTHTVPAIHTHTFTCHTVTCLPATLGSPLPVCTALVLPIPTFGWFCRFFLYLLLVPLRCHRTCTTDIRYHRYHCHTAVLPPCLHSALCWVHTGLRDLHCTPAPDYGFTFGCTGLHTARGYLGYTLPYTGSAPACGSAHCACLAVHLGLHWLPRTVTTAGSVRYLGLRLHGSAYYPFHHLHSSTTPLHCHAAHTHDYTTVLPLHTHRYTCCLPGCLNTTLPATQVHWFCLPCTHTYTLQFCSLRPHHTCL